jgi:hypothetical protein
VELFLGLTFLHPDTIVKRLPIPIHTHIRDTYYARVGCCKGECWLLNIFYSFQHRLSKEQYRPVRVELRIELLSEVQKEVSQP